MVRHSRVDASTFNEHFAQVSAPLRQSATLADLVKRPELSLKELLSVTADNSFADENIDEVEFNVKYEGYVRRQQELLEKFKRMENKKIPEHMDFNSMGSLSQEAREKLMMIRPRNLGQASRISGISHADLSVLMILLEREQMSDVSRGT
jgi:tRNA uridine 5-carboxymethylaminomethyl modification enzyme